MLTIGSLFSGIGGLELGLERAGLGPVVWQVEIDPFCRRWLNAHWPEVERFEDVRTVGSALVPVDLVCGGFPCQDVSSAGSRRGLAGSRSGLWFEFSRIVELLQPRWVVVENVASGARLWVDEVRSGLGQLGYETLPIPLSAHDVGAPYLRRRVFVVAAHPDGDPQHVEPLNAEMAGSSQSIADADREHVREQQRRSGGSGGSHEAESRGACWWSTQPEVDAVVSGFPGRVDHQRALGNAVVPQVAEVIGRLVLALERARK